MPPRKSQSPFGSRKHSMPLMVMPRAQIMALPVAPGDCIQYRTVRMLPEDPLRVCTVDEVRGGVLALSDGEHLHRRDCVWLRRQTPDVSDGRGDASPADPPGMGTAAGTGEYTRGAAAPAGEASTPAGGPGFDAAGTPSAPMPPGLRAPPTIPRRVCADCGTEYQPSGNRQVRCPACRRAETRAALYRYREAKRAQRGPRELVCPDCGTAFQPTGNRQVRCAPCGGERRLARDRARTAARYAAAKAAGRPPGPALVSLPPPGGAEEPPAPAPAPATGAAAAVASARADSAAGAPIPGGSAGDMSPRPSQTLPSSIRALGKRVRGYAERLDQAAHLVACAEQALAILDAYPVQEE